MADGDLSAGSLPLDLIQPPVDFSLPNPNIDLASPFTLTGGSPGAVSAPAATGSTTPAGLYGTSWATPSLVATGWAAQPQPGGSAAAAAAGGGGGNWLSTTAGNIGDWISKNPMSAIGALAGGGMLLNQMFGSSSDQEAAVMKQLGQQAGSAASTATMLQAPLTSGVLPPGAQAVVDEAQRSGRTAAISSYAKMGMSGSTGEADAIQASNQRTQAMKFGIANDLFTQAAGYAKMASSDYAQLLQFQMQQDQDFSNALSKFVSAIAGGAGTSKTSASGTTIDPAALVQAEHAYAASNPLLTS